MKLSVAAAAIAFSGTALVLTPATASAAQQDMKPQATAKAGWDGAGAGKAGLWTAKGTTGAGKMQGMAKMDGMGGPLEVLSDDEAGVKVASAEAGGKFATADAGGKFESAEVDGKFDTADMDMNAKFAQADTHMGSMDMAGKSHEGMGGPEEDMASAKQASSRDSSMPVETAAVSKEATAPGAAMGQGKEAYAGMGGPEEATTEYPPCSPGPGDDRCIQLYERGVGNGKAARA